MALAAPVLATLQQQEADPRGLYPRRPQGKRDDSHRPQGQCLLYSFLNIAVEYLTLVSKTRGAKRLKIPPILK